MDNKQLAIIDKSSGYGGAIQGDVVEIKGLTNAA